MGPLAFLTVLADNGGMRSFVSVSFLTLALVWGTYLTLGKMHSRFSSIQPEQSVQSQIDRASQDMNQLVRNTDTPSPQGSFSDAMKKVVSKNSGITEFVAREESGIPIDAMPSAGPTKKE